ncbi:recombinase family protein [Aeoliella sp. ICT_H6.2]|uniref:Recombinase family protein n=1 Tax=Aeoliella straminimaris TaxID=2954799 RepID=A0A9X2FDQ6_9BACT|nr:recombinase family protein [Aeoliella straminimaris]MCO6046177.1 recombinase family protein [Aeoliella straminimaris]
MKSKKRVKSAAKVAVYVRVSTTSQKAASQRAEIERWMASQRLSDAVWYVDSKSGTDLRRPEFERLQTAVFAGKVKTVVVYKLDRISRSLVDGINTLVDWCQRGIRVVSVTQQLDFNGAAGQLIASVLFAVAEMEQEMRRERQSAGIAAAKARGVYKGRQSGTTKAKPDRALELRKMGLKDQEIATALGVSRRTVQRYLRSVE